jgi:CDK inhibitor PHO81
VFFDVNIITPFDGATLEIAGAVETYWKSTANAASSTLAPQHNISAWQASPGSTQTSPSNPSVVGPSAYPLIVSSLSGNHVYLVVQVTRDLIPVVFNDWRLPEDRFDLGVADVTLAQFEILSQQNNRHLNLEDSKVVEQDVLLSHSMIALKNLLTVGEHALFVYREKLMFYSTYLRLTEYVLSSLSPRGQSGNATISHALWT